MINKTTENDYKLVKVLNEYETFEEAKEDLVKLLTNKITERKLLKKFSCHNPTN